MKKFGVITIMLMSNLLTVATKTLTDTSTIPDAISIENLTDSTKTFADLINEYGPYVVIMALFMVILIAVLLFTFIHYNNLVKSLIKDKEGLMKNLSAQNETMLSSMMNINKEQKVQTAQIAETKEKAKHKAELLNSFIDVNLLMKSICKSIADELDCERIGIYLFHNGNESISGFPFFKMSCIWEWCKIGSSALQAKPVRNIAHKEIPIYTYPQLLESLKKDGSYISTDIKAKGSECLELINFTSYSEITSVFIYVIKDKHDSLIGFVSTEFADKVSDEEEPNIKENIEKLIEEIKPIIIQHNSDAAGSI